MSQTFRNYQTPIISIAFSLLLALSTGCGNKDVKKEDPGTDGKKEESIGKKGKDKPGPSTMSAWEA